MKHICHYLRLVVALLFSTTLFAQIDLDEVQNLDEVMLTNHQLDDFSTGQKQFQLTDSVIRNNQSFLSDLLQFNTPISFRQNGYGMVASPSFRGTTAQQTAVVWNGININSQFNGQSDFNTLLTPNFQEISVRPGGGSVVYGTGAIGGSVHLNNKLYFKNKTRHSFQATYGSFSTIDGRYQLNTSTEKWSFQLGLSHLSSENDYRISSQNRANINGEFSHQSVTANIGHKINRNNVLKFYSWLYLGDKNLSVIRPSDTKSAYENQDLRTLLEWENRGENYRSTFRTAFLQEDFSYIQNIDRDSKTSNLADTYILRYDFLYRFNIWKLNFIADYNQSQGSGDDIVRNTRKVGSLALLAKRKIAENIDAEASLRQELSTIYDSPLLFSFGVDWEITKQYAMKFHASRNYRIPTFNDLFWQDSGKLDLLPESSLQAEWNNAYHFKNGQISVGVFYNDIKDMIRWRPHANGVYRPENVDRVATYGIESESNWQFSFDEFQFNVNANYAYTVAENLNTGDLLTYVPKHKFTSGFAVSYKRWEVDTQFIFHGEVFTRSDNNPDYKLNDYALQNFGIEYQLTNQPKINAGIRAFNLWNVDYQTIENRPMPGRYYQLLMNINF
ncbi:MAG: TonB-dependent receptor plug domain-containing protein [Bacteroidota bacterium]